MNGGCFRRIKIIKKAKNGVPRQQEEAAGKSFWTFALAHASLPEDLRV